MTNKKIQNWLDDIKNPYDFVKDALNVTDHHYNGRYIGFKEALETIFKAYKENESKAIELRSE